MQILKTYLYEYVENWCSKIHDVTYKTVPVFVSVFDGWGLFDLLTFLKTFFSALCVRFCLLCYFDVDVTVTLIAQTINTCILEISYTQVSGIYFTVTKWIVYKNYMTADESHVIKQT